MRYTTVIDISEIPAVYKNQAARLLYIHMALKSGYHDDDRDLLDCSIRALALQSGLSVSAVRHALGVLQTAGLLSRNGRTWRVKKWIVNEIPTPRKQQAAVKPITEEQKKIQKNIEDLEAYKERVYSALRQCDREELQAWLEELQQGRCIKHHGAYINANRQNIEWLSKIVHRT